MNKFAVIFLIILATTISLNAQEPAPTPIPALKEVPPEKLIRPEEGVGTLNYGASINETEQVFGRGVLIPSETDTKGNTITTLKYIELGLVLKYLNGYLGMVIIDRPGFAIRNGAQVGGDVGDFIREFGTKYHMEKSIVQVPDPDKEFYELLWENIAVEVQGRIVKKIKIKTNKNFKGHK